MGGEQTAPFQAFFLSRKGCEGPDLQGHFGAAEEEVDSPLGSCGTLGWVCCCKSRWRRAVEAHG